MTTTRLSTPALLTLLVFGCLFTANCTNFDIIVTCQKCLSACGVSNCLRVAGPGYEHEICPTTSCELTVNGTLQVSACQYDYLGATCSSNICVAPYKRQGCATDLWGFTTCTNYFTIQQACQTCTVQNSSCTQCLWQKELLTNQATQRCLGTSGCNGVPNGTAYIYQCSKDVFGSPCTCCYNITSSSSTANYPSICSASYAPTNYQKFYNYALNRLQATSSELYTMLSMLVLCLLAFVQ